jgi:hypothetical protein
VNPHPPPGPLPVPRLLLERHALGLTTEHQALRLRQRARVEPLLRGRLARVAAAIDAARVDLPRLRLPPAVSWA